MPDPTGLLDRKTGGCGFDSRLQLEEIAPHLGNHRFRCHPGRGYFLTRGYFGGYFASLNLLERLALRCSSSLAPTVVDGVLVSK